MQRYGQIYEEVRALRKETRHSVQDLRERFKEKGVIQNKDQFIVKLIAQVGGCLVDWILETPAHEVVSVVVEVPAADALVIFARAVLGRHA